MNIQVSKTKESTAYDYGTISNYSTPAQIHDIVRNMYLLISESWKTSDLTFKIGNYEMRVKAEKVDRREAESCFQKIIGEKFRSEIEIAYWFEEQLGRAIPGLEIGSKIMEDEYLDENNDPGEDSEKSLVCTFGLYAVPGFYNSIFRLAFEHVNGDLFIYDAEWI